MQLTINGEARDVPGIATLADLVAALSLDMRLAAVERNQAIVPQSAYGATALAEGDKLEFVTFIGGG